MNAVAKQRSTNRPAGQRRRRTRWATSSPANSTSRTASPSTSKTSRVSFDGFKALNELTLAIDAGELRCIIGPNGAGKTTMMDVITGKTRPDAGKAFFGQTIDLLRLTEPEIAQIGIGRKFQKPTVFEQLTRVREPRTGAEDRQARARPACSPAGRRRSATASPRS